MSERATSLRIAGAVAAVAAIAVTAIAFTYGVAHRAGRGATCFEVAVSTQDTTGRSLRTHLLSRPGAKWDYSFWGGDCTISIYAPDGDGQLGGRWRYVIDEATLYADDPDAVATFPAAGRWQLQPR
jgi:hypothetical protein